jgi:hypothetical protein
VGYSAAEVNLVMDGRGLVELIDNGVPMYSLIHRDRFLSRTLELTVRSPGLRLYAFTFGTCVPR